VDDTLMRNFWSWVELNPPRSDLKTNWRGIHKGETRLWWWKFFERPK